MSNTLMNMPKPSKGKKARPPSRENISYTAIPKDYAELLKELTAEGEKYEGRSVSFLTKVAVRAFLKAEGKLSG